MAMIFERIQTDGIAELSYLVGDDSESVATVIDLRPDVTVYLELAREHKVAITHLSTGGGAFLSGKSLPAIEVLQHRETVMT